MKVAPTKVMAKELAKYFKDKKIIESIDYEEMSLDKWRWYVNSFEFPTEYDVNPRNGNYRAIRITYNYECYACPRYLDFNTLNRLAQNCNRSFDTFMKNVWKEIEI